MINLALPPSQLAQRVATRGDEVSDVYDLLMCHVAVGTPECEARSRSRAIALACLGDNHLWQDLGLPSRESLSMLLKSWYPDLVAKNTGGMRWKKFFYKQLCERESIDICKSPSCAICEDYRQCFGPEH
ncbi:MAG: nitrogen fixation protein NifQ [Rubrivivax sp.]|nr:nitrogen fixation protein NifQ [Rubrivivax sp.]